MREVGNAKTEKNRNKKREITSQFTLRLGVIRDCLALRRSDVDFQSFHRIAAVGRARNARLGCRIQEYECAREPRLDEGARSRAGK